jgi:hypothetical protein
MELAVNVTAHGHGAAHRLHIRLILQNFSRLVAQPFDIGFGEWLTLPERFDPFVYIGVFSHG